MRLRKNRGRAALIAAVVAGGLAAGAFAYWIGSGAGSADAIVGSPEQLTISAGTPDGDLVPGDTASVTALATNPNPYFVTIHSLDLDSGGIQVDSGHSGCSTSAIHFVAKPAPVGIFGPGWRVPPKVDTTNGTLSFSIAGALAMDANASDACQGATFTVHLIAGS
jgi:hypothetical protein